MAGGIDLIDVLLGYKRKTREELLIEELENDFLEEESSKSLESGSSEELEEYSEEKSDQYLFPAKIDKHGLHKLSGIRLMEHLNDLVLSCDNVKQQYPRVREVYCSLSVELNERHAKGERGVPAPAFRPRLSRTSFPTGSLCDLSNDTQVIDFHYLYLAGFIDAQNKHARRAVEGGCFSFNNALEFVATAGSSDDKLEYLGYAPDGDAIDLVLWGALSIKPSSCKELDRNLYKLFKRREVELARRRDISPRVDKKLWAALSIAEIMIKKSDQKCSAYNLGIIVKQMIGKFDSPERSLKTKLKQTEKFFGKY